MRSSCLYIFTIIIAFAIVSCDTKKVNALTGTEDIEFSGGLVDVSKDTLYNAPILSIDEYNRIDSMVRIAATRDSNYLHYKDILRDEIGKVTDHKLKDFMVTHNIPLDSVSLFERQIKSDFGLNVNSIINKDKSLGDSIACEVIVNYDTSEFPNLIYSKDAFCSWEPTFKTELYASFIDNTMYMLNDYPSKFGKRYQITILDKGEKRAIYTLILTEIYRIYSKSVNNVKDNFMVSTIALDGHYEWAYFRTYDN